MEFNSNTLLLNNNNSNGNANGPNNADDEGSLYNQFF